MLRYFGGGGSADYRTYVPCRSCHILCHFFALLPANLDRLVVVIKCVMSRFLIPLQSSNWSPLNFCELFTSNAFSDIIPGCQCDRHKADDLTRVRGF